MAAWRATSFLRSPSSFNVPLPHGRSNLTELTDVVVKFLIATSDESFTAALLLGRALERFAAAAAISRRYVAELLRDVVGTLSARAVALRHRRIVLRGVYCLLQSCSDSECG